MVMPRRPGGGIPWRPPRRRMHRRVQIARGRAATVSQNGRV